MNFSELIDLKLEQKGMSKKELYDTIKSSFYDPNEEKYISVPTFYSRISENKITAEDMLYISAVLDINLTDIQEKIKQLVKTRKTAVCLNFKLLMQIHSAWYSNADEVYYLSTNDSSAYTNNRFYLITTNKNRNSIALELFDFDLKNLRTLITVNLNKEIDGFNLEDFKILSNDNKLKYLLDKKSENELILGAQKLTKIYAPQYKKFDIPDDISYKVDFSWNNTVDRPKSPVVIQSIEDKLITKLSNGFAFGRENKTEIVNLNTIGRVSFKITSSHANYINNTLAIYNKINIEQVW